MVTNGMSSLRYVISDFMEHNEFFTKLKGLDWYKAEDTICELVEKLLRIKPDDNIFSQCEQAASDDTPTLFEEDVYKRVDRYYHRTDILNAIEADQEQRNWEGIPRLVYQMHDIEALTDKYENSITGEENLQIARETLLNYQCHNVFEEVV